MDKQRDNFETALANAEKGYVSIPIHPGTKVPAIKWKPYQTLRPTEEDYCLWFADTRNNIAILTTGLVVFDCETAEKARLVIENCGETSHMLKSPGGGVHLGYRKRKGVLVQNLVKIKGMPIDIRTDGGLELIPNSETEKGRYEWLGAGLKPITELPVAKVGWTRTRARKALQTAVAEPADPSSLLYRGQKYVDCFEPAVSGQGGHTKTFIAALKIAKFVHKDPELAWQLLCYFNMTKCEPEWDEAALRHKWQDALKKAR